MKLCPNCKDGENLGTSESIGGIAECTVLDDGEIEHGGYTHVFWDSSTTETEYNAATDEDEPVIYCRNCDWTGKLSLLIPEAAGEQFAVLEREEEKT